MGYKVDKVKWKAFSEEIRSVREKVFVYEYRLPRNKEFDNNDLQCEHVLIRDDDGAPIATGRLCEDGKISRIAVVLKHRKSDAAKRVIEKLVAIAKTKGLKQVSIDSELEDVKLYLQHGFRAVGGVYMESGIAKQTLQCSLNQFSGVNNILH